MFILVKSDKSNYRLREAVRHSWASARQLGEVSLRTVFVVDEGNQSENSLIHHEHELHGDILQFRGEANVG